jgi:hypothetical protein
MAHKADRILLGEACRSSRAHTSIFAKLRGNYKVQRSMLRCYLSRSQLRLPAWAAAWAKRGP